MASDLVLNVCKGRVAELVNRVDSNDPAASTIVVVLIAASGIETDAVLRDKVTLADYVAGTTNEATNTGYARKVLTDADIVAVAPDQVNDRMDVDIPDLTWTGLQNDGTGAIAALLVCYDPSSTGVTASVIVPMTQHAFAVTPDGSDVTAQIAATGFFRAS